MLGHHSEGLRWLAFYDRFLALHPLLLEEAILQRAVTGVSLDVRLTLLKGTWTRRTAKLPENEDLLKDLTLRAASKAREALEKGQLVAPPSIDELQHLLSSEVREVRLIAILLLRSARAQ